jgi:hypothetical protein
MSLDKDDEEGMVEIGGETQAEEVAYDDADDEGTEVGADDKAGKKEDERLGADPDAANDEVVRAEKREARRKKRKNQKEWARRNILELEFLRGQNEKLEGEVAKIRQGQQQLTHQSQAGRIDAALDALQEKLDEVDEVIAAAVTASDGAEIVRANRLRDEIRDRMLQAKLAKQSLPATSRTSGSKVQEADGNKSEEGTAAEAQVVAQRTAQQNARIFASRHDWFDGKNKESQAALRADQALRSEGFRPDQAAFWVELETRLKTEIPHKFKDVDDTDEDEDDDEDGDSDHGSPVGKGKDQKGAVNGKAKGGPAISAVNGRASGSGNGSKTYRISAERKQAMVDAGIWEDLPLRNKMIKRYIAYDKQHGLNK